VEAIKQGKKIFTLFIDDHILKLMGDLPRIELFTREHVPG